MTKWKKKESITLTRHLHSESYCSIFSLVMCGSSLLAKPIGMLQKNVSHTPHAHPWEDVTVSELKAFIGLLILIGRVHLPRLEMYWQVKHPVIATEGISSIMSWSQFEQIFRFLHLADSTQQIPAGQLGHDKLFKDALSLGIHKSAIIIL